MIPLLSRRLVSSILLALLPFGTMLADEFRASNIGDFDAMIAKARPGDVIVLASGSWKDVEIVADAIGTSTSPITIRAEQPGKVTISGNSRLRIAGSHVVVTGLRFENAWHKTALVEFRRDSKRAANDCRFTDSEIVHCTPPDPKIGFKFVSIYGRGNAIDRCRFEGKTNEGATLVVWLDEGEPNWGEHTIANNHFGPRPELGRNGGETIRIGDSDTAHRSAKTIVDQNLFEECNGEGEIVSNKSCDNVYQRNVFLRCSGALTLRHGHRARVECNLFLGQKARGSGGVRIVGSDHVVINNYFEQLEGDDLRSALCVMNGILETPANGYDAVERATIAHNTFYDCKRTLLIGCDNDAKRQVAPQDCLFANNVIVSRRGPLIDLNPDAKGLRWLGNRYYGEGELGIEPQAGVERLNMLPLKVKNDRWTLFDGSPLINAGAAFEGAPATDLLGRGRDRSPDVGCDEWPLADDVGPVRNVNFGPTWTPPQP